MVNYEVYNKLISFDEYIKTWKDEDIKKSSPKDRLQAYTKFMFRFKVLNRDNFTCQHMGEDGTGCPYCKNLKYHPKLTAHHVKHQRNIKKKYTDEQLYKKLYNIRNGVTICESSHQAFNRFKIGLRFLNEQIPPHIRGHTFWLYKPEKVVKKELSIKGKKLKKKYKNEKYILTTKDIPLVLLLFRLLYVPYYNLNN